MFNEQVVVPPSVEVGLADLEVLSARAAAVIQELKKAMLIPDANKTPPLLSGEKVAALCELTRGQMVYRIKNGAPAGQVNSRGGRRELTVAEVQEWTRQERTAHLRPKGAKAAVLSVAFFKGGVTKTSTTMALAQGLSLLGHRVLTLDLDPQGSLTTLTGFIPEQIAEEQTLNPLFFGIQNDVRYAIRETYWPGLHLIPATSALFSSEIALSNRQLQNTSFQFWSVLEKGLEAVREDYDVILIDTPPALSYVTLNAFMAADGMIVPMTPNVLDLASSAQFWNLFHQLAADVKDLTGHDKIFDFVNILISKVNNQEQGAQAARQWIHSVYGAKVCPVEIPLTTVTSSKVNEFKTVFDVERYEGDSRTYKRAREAYESLALYIEQMLGKVWTRQIANADMAATQAAA